MTTRCFFLGCKWNAGVSYWAGREKLLAQICCRCGAHRTVAE